MLDYTPAPLDVEDIELPECLAPMIETLAEHVHDTWARERLEEGWTHGPKRSDEAKQHPCLVKYENLSEQERKYDRITAINTLQMIIKLGYQIVAPDDSSQGDTQVELVRLAEIEMKLRSREPGRTRDLRTFWQDRKEHLWALRPSLYETLADTLLKRGYPLWANEVLIEGLKVTPSSVRLRQLHALGLMRSGRPRLARAILEALVAEDEGHRTGETLGLLASTHKVGWSSAQDESEKRESLEQCYEIYRLAFERTGEYYPGINAAAMAVVSGEMGAGKRIATEVEAICSENVRGGDRSYWTLATLAEAALIKGEPDQATDLYEQAVEVAGDNIDSISATRHQALMLAAKLGVDDSAIRRALPVPPVAVFGGPPCWSDEQVRLPNIGDEAAFREKVRREIRKSQLQVAYASGVGGGDLIFLETVIEENGEAHLVLPAPAADLARFFGRFGAPGEAWVRRLDHVLSRASSATVVSRELGSANAEQFRYANRILAGAAVLRSRALGTPVCLIELESPTGKCVTPFGNREVFSKIYRLPVPDLSWGEPITTSTSGLTAEVKGILFADLKGYSKMPEAEIPIYITEFLAEAGKLCDNEPGLQFRNTWGDAFYLVFDSVRTAAQFGRRLRSFVKDTDWLARGFSQNFGIRIALHAGPLFAFDDPVLHSRAYTGQHTSRAARIEPITDEGQIFVSEPFACLASEGNASELKFEYLGRRALAKEYGDEGLFMLL